jgi:hypothetical protein
MYGNVFKNLYQNCTNLLICSPKAWHSLYHNFQDKIEKKTNTHNGYFMDEYRFLGIKVETSMWTDTNTMYYFNNNGKMSTLVIDFDKNTFTVASEL